MNFSPDRFSIAPMLDWTDRHCRYFHRQLTKKAMLYTEMVTTAAILHSKRDHLIYNEEEHPLTLQLGGSDPKQLAICAKQAEKYGYDAINLNVGCPSYRVQHGRFGACLMADAQRVASCVAAMRNAVTIPITVKNRIGIDHFDSYLFLIDFIETIKPYCNTFIVHARKALLTGLNPKENREIPPLDYERVYQLKKDFPELTIIINGGVKTITEAKLHLKQVDGVMVGREAYHNPMLLLDVDHQFFSLPKNFRQPVDIIRSLYPYIEQQLQQNIALNHMTRHFLGFFQGMPGAKQWRRYLSECAHQKGADCRVIENALTYISP